VLGLTVLLAVLIVIANLVVDVLHRGLDPRLREEAYARA
jgi:ABC-type dipeptide/oligopeptide/nickel transport system permease component